MQDFELRLSHLQKSFGRPVLQDINLQAARGSYITILGRSGSGKSTLLNILGMVEEYDSGEYLFNGTLIRKHKDYSRLRRENIGFIFQSCHLIPTLSCRENILLPLLYESRSCASRLDELVEQLGIQELLSQRVNTLSGGEMQRAAFARALMLDPCLILADEPTGNLDTENRNRILDLLDQENQKGRAIILITHDPEVAARAKTIYHLKDGVLHEKT